MHTSDLAMPAIVGGLLIILLVGLLLRRFKQPHVVGYLVAGIVLGPSAMGLVTDHDTLSRLGDFGVMFLLFFIGMEVSLPRLLARWKLVIASTVIQVGLSVGMMFILGHFAGWTHGRAVLMGFIISLSSTAVVIKILEDWQEINTETGQKVLGILLFQDIILIPMIIVLSFFGSKKVDVGQMVTQTIGGVLIIALLAWVMIKGEFKLPYAKHIRKDHELQIFVALVICFGLAFATSSFGLSSALGAFVAGILVSFSQETKWIQYRLESFKVVFVALFFVSIGMLLDLSFMWHNLPEIIAIVFAVFVVNSLIMAALFRIFRHEWRSCLYAGALLSQIGEFGFVLVLTGKHMNFVSEYTYQLTLAIIALTLLLSPMWISFVKKGRDVRLSHVVRRFRRKQPEPATIEPTEAAIGPEE